jgi:hypothetical protein
MVPNMDWAGAVREFGRAQGRQVTLCARCFRRTGDLTPPTTIIISDGESMCVEHFAGAIPGRLLQ